VAKKLEEKQPDRQKREEHALVGQLVPTLQKLIPETHSPGRGAVWVAVHLRQRLDHRIPLWLNEIPVHPSFRWFTEIRWKRARSAFLAHLIVNPAVGLLHSVPEFRGGFPAKKLFDERIVAVAAFDSLGRTQVVTPLELDSRDVLHHVDQLVDRNQLAAAKVERFENIARQDRLRPMNAVIDIHETARLMAVSPNLDLVLPGKLGLDHLAADRSRGLLPAAIVGAMRPVDIVITRHAGVEAEILAEMPAHALAEQLFPAVSILRHRGIGVAFLERSHVR